VPWVVDGQHRLLFCRHDGAAVETFIQERSLVHREYIRQVERTKRLGYGLSAALFAAAIFTPLIAPEGREVISLMTSGGLVVFAAGAWGFSKIQITALKQKIMAQKK
jgi:hypothetical protein